MKIIKLLFISVFFLLTSQVSAKDPRELHLSLLDAAKEGDSAQVQVLLDQGAAIKTRNRFGNSTLIYAAREGHLQVAKLLIEKGFFRPLLLK